MFSRAELGLILLPTFLLVTGLTVFSIVRDSWALEEPSPVFLRMPMKP